MFRFYVAILVSAKLRITPDVRLDAITLFASYEWANYWHNYDVALPAGHYVMPNSDSLKRDNVDKSSESRCIVFQNSHFIFSSIS